MSRPKPPTRRQMTREARLSREARECFTCMEYADARLRTIREHIWTRCAQTHEVAEDLALAYMQGVHDRHVAGLSIAYPDQAA